MTASSGFRFRSPAGAAILVGMLLLLFAAGAWLRTLATRAPERLPDLGPAPLFSARDGRGRVWTNGDLAGRVWIADAVTPECGGCLVRNLRMTDLQTSFSRAADIALVTFVADPALSTPGKLREVETAFGALPGRWALVAGAPPFPGSIFAVVDGRGRVRARVPESDPALSSRLLDAAGDLLRESGR
jgi:hypothetical protein